MKIWINDFLLPWFSSIQADKIIFIAGNHDFICDPSFIQTPLKNSPILDFREDILNSLLKKHKLQSKVTYLENNLTVFKGLKIYGCPDVQGCRGWAFSQAEETYIYSSIQECDILITHQPPANSLGVLQTNAIIKDFGSSELLDVITKIKPMYLFCGHIHEGDHSKHVCSHDNGQKTTMHNVSIKNEDYRIAYPPCIVEL